MMEIVIQTAGAFFAIFGFSILLDVPKKFLFWTSGSGAVGWLAYILALAGGRSPIMAAFLSSLAASLFSHTVARIMKAPVTVFLVAGILPTVPGASIYRCVYYLIQAEPSLSSFYLIQTLQIAGAMALAIFIVDSLFRLTQKPQGREEKGEKGSSVCG